MSCCTCSHCGDPFDSDHDLDCFVGRKIICETCREELGINDEFTGDEYYE